MKRFLIVVVLMGCITPLMAQSGAPKPWTEWDKKQVEKILNNSPWGQTQSESDVTRLHAFQNQDGAGRNQPLGPGGIPTTVDRKTAVTNADVLSNTGAPAAAGGTTWNYRIRFFSAKPVREALARQVLLANPKAQTPELQRFIDEDYSGYIVLAVTWDGGDRSYTGIIGQVFDGATTATVKNRVFLIRRDGTRIEIDRYAPPLADGTGAKFVFPKVVDGKLFVSDPEESLHFIADMGRNVKVTWKFKFSEMLYNGKLEY